MKNATPRRFFGWFTLWSYLYALLSPTFANILGPVDPVPLPSFQEGLKMHVFPLDPQMDALAIDNWENLNKAGLNIALLPIIQGKSTPITPSFNNRLSFNHEAVVETSEDDSEGQDMFLDPLDDAPVIDMHEGAIDTAEDHPSPPEFSLTLKGHPTVYRALGTDNASSKDYLQQSVTPGLKGFSYDNVYELFYNDISAGLSWAMEGIGQLSLLWNGHAYLEGDGRHVDHPF